jgi:uncharacterized spore protein YtfJ
MSADTSASLASVAHEVATMLEEEANVRAVFGAPMKLDTRVVIPVARVSCGGGVGGVTALGAAVETIRRFFQRKDAHVTPSRTFVGGGGGGIDVRPVGYLCEEEGRVVFVRIDDARDREVTATRRM